MWEDAHTENQWPKLSSKQPDPLALLPCPFCGRDGKFIFPKGNLTQHSVICSNWEHCLVVPQTRGFDTKREAASAWNHRPGSTIKVMDEAEFRKLRR